jgi:hypothetical protein
VAPTGIGGFGSCSYDGQLGLTIVFTLECVPVTLSGACTAQLIRDGSFTVATLHGNAGQPVALTTYFPDGHWNWTVVVVTTNAVATAAAVGG